MAPGLKADERPVGHSKIESLRLAAILGYRQQKKLRCVARHGPHSGDSVMGAGPGFDAQSFLCRQSRSRGRIVLLPLTQPCLNKSLSPHTYASIHFGHSYCNDVCRLLLSCFSICALSGRASSLSSSVHSHGGSLPLFPTALTPSNVCPRPYTRSQE